MKRSEVLNSLQPYLTWENQWKTYEPGVKCDKCSREETKRMEDLIALIAQENSNPQLESRCWAFMLRHPKVVHGRCVDAIAHSYILAVDALGHRNPLAELLYAAVNMLVAADQVGAPILAELFEDKSNASLRKYNRAKEKVLEGSFGRELNLVRRYFENSPAATRRIRILAVVIALLVVINVAVFFTLHKSDVTGEE